MAEELELISANLEEEQQGDPQEDMELDSEAPSLVRVSENGAGNPEENDIAKRPREEDASSEGGVDDASRSKKQKVNQEKSVEEKRLEKLEDEGTGEEKAKEESDKGTGEEKGKEESDKAQEPVKLGPMTFSSSTVMFDYFYKLSHTWSPHIDINKYEHMVLLDLLKKGHPEPEKKIGDGVQAFQIRNHPLWKNKCFFLVRADGSYDDFSFRKCVHNIIPLPDNMIGQDRGQHVNGGKNGGFHHGGGGGGRGGRGGFHHGGGGRGGRGGKGGRGRGRRM